jgi:acyl-CoA thioesterase-2
MAFDLDDLLGCLELTEAGPGVVEGRNLDIGYRRVFGGQLLAQVLVAAAAASPEKSVKSLHVLFPREGDTAQPMRYRVDRLQDGRTFGTTSVVATQPEADKVISAATVSLHLAEEGLHRSDAPPAVGPPEDATAVDLGMVPWETRLVGGVDLGDRPLAIHQALLAHATDLTIIGTALRPFEGLSQADSTVAIHTAVTSHTLWFHQPFRADDWLLLVQQSPVMAQGRAFGRGDVFAGDELVASFAQESMVRRLEPTA